MSFNNKNEIIKLFRNIQLSKFLTNPIMISNDTNANIVLSSLYMLLKRQDYPIHFDTMELEILYQILYYIDALLFTIKGYSEIILKI